MKYLFFALSLFLLPIDTDHSGTEPKALPVCDINNQTFTGGEELTYQLYYHWGLIWLKAGEVKFTVEEQADAFYLKTKGRSYKSYEWFYKVDDTYETWVDKETLLPRKSIKEIKEGGYRFYSEVTYDRERGIATEGRAKRRGDELKYSETEIESCAHDMVSVLYASRCVDIPEDAEKDTYIPIDLFLDKEAYDLKLRYQEKIDDFNVKKSGKYDVLRFTPDLIAGDFFQEGSEMNIYVGNDNNKVPVLIESPLSVGEIRAVLIDHKGLKYPMDSKR